jgi:hypothetical protein
MDGKHSNALSPGFASLSADSNSTQSSRRMNDLEGLMIPELEDDTALLASQQHGESVIDQEHEHEHELVDRRTKRGRKGHRKSRTGCLNCKRARIKVSCKLYSLSD